MSGVRPTLRSRSATRSRRLRVRGEAVHEQRLGDRRADRHARIEAGERILEDHLHALAQPRASPSRSSARTSWPSSRTRAGRRLDQAQDRAAGGRLAAAGFADQRQRLAGAQAEGDVLDRVHAARDASEQAACGCRSASSGSRPRAPAARPRVADVVGAASATSTPVDRRRPGSASAAARPPSSRAAARRRAARAYRDAAGAAKICAVGSPSSTLSPVPHDHDAVGDLGDHAHVVGDEEHRHALLVLQRLDQLQDLRLDGDVERGGRLVGDQQLRPAGQRHRDHHALAHAAGEAVRIFVRRARARPGCAPARGGAALSASAAARDRPRW